MSLLLEISHCPIAKAIIEGNSPESPCKEVVLSQNSKAIDNFHLPEPWSGKISHAPVLFISSNPSISVTEKYPLWSWSDEMITDYFDNRFGNGWVRDSKSLQEDGTYSKSVAFWSAVQKRAAELFNREVEPGVDYALSEVVHCKSKQEVGVKSAVMQCSEMYLDRIISISYDIRIVVVLGGIARDTMQSLYSLSADNERVLEPVKLGNRECHVVFLPHPNARKRRTFKAVLSQPVFLQLQKLLED